VALNVLTVEGPDVRLIVTEGGPVSNNKGLSLPGIGVSVPALSEKDEEDLRFGLGLRADMVALSFVRSAADITRVHEIMDELGGGCPSWPRSRSRRRSTTSRRSSTPSTGLMVARGDLGVEMPLERVPLVQKRACRRPARSPSRSSSPPRCSSP
jgi:pyruvate kinase